MNEQKAQCFKKKKYINLSIQSREVNGRFVT